MAMNAHVRSDVSLSAKKTAGFITENEITLLSGEQALGLLHDQAFINSWRKLHEICPWATVLQSPDFCIPWYEIYSEYYKPLIVTATGGADHLTGLFALAIRESDGELVVAGAQMAEYQVWISTPETGSSFIERALDALSERLPAKSLRLLFMPSNAPLNWTARNRPWGKYCNLRTIPHPFMDIGDGARFRESLRKKSNKSRLNRLKQMGEVSLKKLTTPEEMDAVLDEIYTFSNFRLAAFHKVAASSRPDSLQRALYIELMKAHRLIHATVLRAGERMVAAHIGVYNRDQVLLGILAYSPLLGRHSPGKLHILLLAEKLSKEAIATFDLTPGGDYKDNFATHYDTAYILNVFFNRRGYIRFKATRLAIESGKKLFGAVGVAPERLKDTINRGRHKLAHFKLRSLPEKLVGRLKKNLWYTGEMRIYAMDAEAARNFTSPCLMKRNCLEDLLDYEPAEAWQSSKDVFLREVIEGIEAGAHIYTYAEAGRLLHYGWLIERQSESFLSEVGQKNYLPPHSAVLADFYSHPAARGRGLYKKSLSQMLRDASDIPETKRIYIGVMADNGPSRHVIEKLGFVYQYSFFQQKRSTATTRWTNAPDAASKAP